MLSDLAFLICENNFLGAGIGLKIGVGLTVTLGTFGNSTSSSEVAVSLQRLCEKATAGGSGLPLIHLSFGKHRQTQPQRQFRQS